MPKMRYFVTNFQKLPSAVWLSAPSAPLPSILVTLISVICQIVVFQADYDEIEL